MIPPWTKNECFICGMEFYLTRTESKPDNLEEEEYMCSNCRLYAEAQDSGYDQGYKKEFQDGLLAGIIQGQKTYEA